MEKGLWKMINAVLLAFTSQLIFEQGHGFISNYHDRLSSSLTLKNSENSFTCTSDGFYGNEMNCSIFHRCVKIMGHGENDSEIFQRYDFVCSPGTIFDTNIDNCNYPWEARPIIGCSGLTNNTNEMTTPHHPRPQAPSKPMKIKLYHVKLGECLQKIGGCSSQVQKSCNSKDVSQDWYLVKIGTTKDGRDRVQFTNAGVGGDMCLEAKDNGDVYLDDCRKGGRCHVGGGQDWILGKDNTIIHEKFGGCLYITNRIARISKEHCYVKWEYDFPVNRERCRIYNAKENKCWTRVYNNQYLYSCDQHEQYWAVHKIGEKDGKQRVKFSSPRMSRCLKGRDREFVDLNICDDAGDQVWLLGKDGTIVNEMYGGCLFVTTRPRGRTLATSKEHCGETFEFIH